MEIRTKNDLEMYISSGNKVKYIFFWGNKKESIVTKNCFSQWYPSPFFEDGKHFQTAEHYMMYRKATLFGDFNSAEKALIAKNPGEAKAIGRAVIYFNEELWNKKRFAIVVKGNLEKFSQNPELGNYLLSTGKRILVEASPIDKIWGIGLSADDKDRYIPGNWPGLNLLGFALMEVRSLLEKRQLGAITKHQKSNF